jgi:hypothetical protein
MGGGETGMKYILNVLYFVFAICAASLAQPSKDNSAVSCAKLPTIRELRSVETTRVLAAFGYSLHQAFDCTKLISEWYGSSAVFLFRSIPTRLDDQTSFSVIFISGSHEIWVLPITSGMLEYPSVESDPHNLAAFNALIAAQAAPVADPEWISLSRSYLAMIGHRKANLSPKVSCKGEQCTVELSEQQSPESFILWTLTFEKTGRLARLQDVSRELRKRE